MSKKSYDYQQLGVDAGVGVENLLPPLEIEPASEDQPARKSEIVSAPYSAADFEPDLRPDVESIADIELAAPSPAPLGKLRKRPR